ASALQQSVLGANLRSREPDDADSAWLTATGSLLGTPAYMPPEQLAGGEIDARADQFAFCSALFEALYDRLPFGGPASARAADILAGRFREPRRGTKAPRWVHRAVLRGLAGDPAERWPSMRDLLDQLARNPRRRQLTTLAMVFLGATATVATLRPWHADPCVGAADALDALWSPQEKERLSGSFEASSLPYSEQLWQQTQKSLDRWAESWRSMRVETCEATWLRGEQSPRRLDLRTDCLNQHLGDFEALVDLLADGTPGMLEHAPAAASRLESVADCANTEELETALPLPDDADARAGIAELRSRVDRVRQLRRLGQFKESWRRAQDLLASPAVDWQESTDEQGLVDTPSTRLKYPPALAEVLIEAGTSARTVEEPDVAHDYLFAAVLESDKGSVDSDRAWALLALADLHIHEPDRAQPWLDLASAAGRRIDDPALLVQRLIVEARLQRTKGRLEPALRAARQAVEVAEESQGGVGRATEAQARRLVLLLLRLLGERTGILEQIEALLADQRAIYGDGHPQVLSLMLDRGEALLAVGRAPEATEVFRRAAQRAASTLGRSSYAYAVTLESLSGGYLGQGDLENAEQKAREAIAIYDLQGDAAFERQTGSRHNLAAVLWSAGRLDEAESLFTNVLAQRDARYERPHVRLIPVETMLGRLRMEKGELKSALELLSSARRQALVVYPTENTKSLHAGLAYGMALIEAGRASQGAQLIDSLAPLVPSEGSEPWIRALALWSHATAAASRGDRAEALELAQDARRLYLTMRGEGRRQRERIDRWIAAGLETPMNEPWS
ncbi:MAG: tetratricopeptide repeat-containing protein kinase family protein, partial [Acidobacteriota bacterium]